MPVQKSSKRHLNSCMLTMLERSRRSQNKLMPKILKNSRPQNKLMPTTLKSLKMLQRKLTLRILTHSKSHLNIIMASINIKGAKLEEIGTY